MKPSLMKGKCIKLIVYPLADWMSDTARLEKLARTVHPCQYNGVNQ